jgi:segregation and condensation protein B
MSSESSRAIEAVLMVAQEPVDPQLLAQLLEVAPARVDELCAELQAEYEAGERGFVLVKVAGGYRFQSHADMAAYVERFVLEGQNARLSSAALETLAIVAYKQPLSRAQVAAIRGVNVDGVMRTLQQRGYVAEVGRDSGPGQATLFGTTPEFLERLGLATIDDLPPIAELFPSADVMEALERGLLADVPRNDVVDGDTGADAGAAIDAGEGGEGEELDAAAAAPVPVPEAVDEGGDFDDADVVIDLDDRPEPEPPSWAIDADPAEEEQDDQSGEPDPDEA